MCQTFSDTNWGAPGSILGSVVGGQGTLGPRLAAGAREVGCQIGRLAGVYALAWKPASIGEGGPLRLPDLIYVGLSNVGGAQRRFKGAMRSFFGRGADAARGGALVAWSTVCQPI